MVHLSGETPPVRQGLILVGKAYVLIGHVLHPPFEVSFLGAAPAGAGIAGLGAGVIGIPVFTGSVDGSWVGVIVVGGAVRGEMNIATAVVSGVASSIIAAEAIPE